MAMKQQNTENPPSAGHWQNLETPGDVRRYFRWLILATASDKIDTRKAGVLGQLGLYLLKATQASDFEERLGRIERALQVAVEVTDSDTGSQTTAH